MNLKVKDVCKSKGITITQLAEILGVKQESVSRAINGNPTVETLQKIANALDVSIVDLFENNSKGFTALIDNDGLLYKASNIAELEKIVSELKTKE